MYTPYATSTKEQTGDVIRFTQFEEGIILNETHNDAESGDESNNESIMMSEYESRLYSRSEERRVESG